MPLSQEGVTAHYIWILQEMRGGLGGFPGR